MPPICVIIHRWESTYFLEEPTAIAIRPNGLSDPDPGYWKPGSIVFPITELRNRTISHPAIRLVTGCMIRVVQYVCL